MVRHVYSSLWLLFADEKIVTREEAAWESFSEDEPAPKRPKTSTPAPAAAKGKKGSKIGQGNIMSFFKKT